MVYKKSAFAVFVGIVVHRLTNRMYRRSQRRETYFNHSSIRWSYVSETELLHVKKIIIRETEGMCEYIQRGFTIPIQFCVQFAQMNRK